MQVGTAPGQGTAGWAWREGRGRFWCSHHPSIRVSVNVEKPTMWQSQSRSPHSPVKLDLFPGITRSTLKKIFTEFIFTSRSPSSQGARRALPPSSQLSLHLPRASSRSPSPRAATMPSFVRGTMFAVPEDGGIAHEKGCCPSPRPRAALGGGEGGIPAGMPMAGERQPRRGDKYSWWRRQGGKKEKEGPGLIQGPSFFSVA